jgi:hypothetical protein
MKRITVKNKVIYTLSDEENILLSVQRITPAVRRGNYVKPLPDEIAFLFTGAKEHLTREGDFLFCLPKKEAVNLIIAIEDLNNE